MNMLSQYFSSSIDAETVTGFLVIARKSHSHESLLPIEGVCGCCGCYKVGKTKLKLS